MHFKHNKENSIITDHRIKQTLKNLIKDDFFKKYNVHPAERRKAIKIAQQHLTNYCHAVLEDNHLFSVLCHKILLDTYCVTAELQEKYSEEDYKKIIEDHITQLWSQLQKLSLEDWEEYNIPPHLLEKTVWDIVISTIQIIILWLTNML